MDIVSLPPEIDRSKIDSRYRLVLIASQRAKSLAQGARSDLATNAIKHTTRALEEALESKLEFVTGDAARTARAEALKAEAKRLEAEAERREHMGADLSELERDLHDYLSEKTDKERRAIEDLFSAPESELEDESGVGEADSEDIEVSEEE